MEGQVNIEDVRTTKGRGRRYDNFMDKIGDTPDISIKTLAPDHVQIYVTAEFLNPAPVLRIGGMVKAVTALYAGRHQ